MDLGGVIVDSLVKHAHSQLRVRVLGDAGTGAEPQLHNSLPSIPLWLLEHCRSLMQMRPAQALTAEEEGAEGSSKVTGLAESWISCLEKKMILGFCSPVLQLLKEVRFISEDFTACAVVI